MGPFLPCHRRILTSLPRESHLKLKMAELDMVNRDPNNINDHLKVTFEDVLAEPEGAHSMDCVWSCSYKCFNCCKDLAYMILTLFYGICIAMEWGCEFGQIAFIHIWYVTPCFKVCEINCGCLHAVRDVHPLLHRPL